MNRSVTFSAVSLYLGGKGSYEKRATTIRPIRRGLERLPASCLIKRPEEVREARDNGWVATTSYLDRLLDPLTDILTPGVANAVLRLRADSETEARITELRHKANEGTLTPAEDAEYKEFVEAVDLISIIQTKARHFLAKHPA